MSRFVFKFGGASVKDAKSVQNVAKIIEQYASGSELLVVVSAMGKTTNALEHLYQNAYDLGQPTTHFQEIERFHLDIVDALFDDENTVRKKIIRSLQQLKVLIEEVADFNSYDEGYDAIISFGEILSSQIVVGYLQTLIKATWIDARKYITTDTTHREGKVDFSLTNNLIEQDLVPLLSKQVLVTQGFIGASVDNKTTTLGREGSDYSAAIFAAAIEAEELTIWKDVAGVLTADPKKMSDAELFPHLSYQDAAEMTFYGATVIHPKTIRPLALAEIPMRVKSFLHPEASGTLIGPKPKDKPLPAYIFKENQILISVGSKDLAFVTEHELISLLELAKKLNININLLQTSAISISIVVDYLPLKVNRFIEVLQANFSVQYNIDLELITIKSYNPEAIDKVVKDRKKYLEQITRNNYQVVLVHKNL